MIRGKTQSILLVVALSACCSSAYAELPKLGFEAEVDVVSAYVWRGLVINDEACIQPSLTVTTGDLSLNLWATWDLTDVEGSSEHTRVDGTLDYTTALGRHIVSAGLIGYLYRDDPGGGSADTAELFAGYALDVVLLPSLSLYYDIEKEGVYVSVAAAHSFELIDDRMALDLNLSLGVGDEHYNNDAVGVFVADGGVVDYSPSESALVDFTARVTLPIYVGERWLVTPGLKYATLLDSDIRDAIKEAGKEDDQFVFTLRASVSF